MYMTAEQSQTLHGMQKRPHPQAHPPAPTNAPPEARQCVPRYLFRAYSNGSRNGLQANNSLHIHPDDEKWCYPASGDAAGTRQTLEEHLTWNTGHASEFTSWTSSLLCALRHALRKRYCWNEPEQDIYIAVLDTSNFALPVWAAAALYDAYGIQPRRAPGKSWMDLERHYYFGEYLVRGGVSAAGTPFCVASLEQLREEGLHELLPELFAPGNRARIDLACSIRDDRDVLCATRGETPTRPEMELCRRLGECFAEGTRGSAFVFPVAVAFLALRRWAVLFAPGHSARMALEDEVLDELRGLEIPDSLGGEEDFCSVIASRRRFKPEEAILFRDLCQRLVARSRGERNGDGDAEERGGGHGRVQSPENDLTPGISRLSGEFSIMHSNNKAYRFFSCQLLKPREFLDPFVATAGGI